MNDLERPGKDRPKGIFSDNSPAGGSTPLVDVIGILALTKTLQLFAEYFGLHARPFQYRRERR